MIEAVQRVGKWFVRAVATTAAAAATFSSAAAAADKSAATAVAIIIPAMNHAAEMVFGISCWA
jgi:hypothetical protein